jgi:hypothetical protein
MKIDGACHCGRIRYEAEVDPERTVICHCTACHKQFVIDPMLKAQGGPGTSTLPQFPKDMPRPASEKR